MNKIDWHKYADYIFCLHYLENNRLNEISKTLTDVGVDIYDSSFFSFSYDIGHCIFKEQYQNMKETSFDFYNDNVYFKPAHLYEDYHNYIFYLGLNTYYTLKITQHFNYDRIIIFEDDIHFLKDTDYIIKAMDFIKEQDFDICMCQTAFKDAFHGVKSDLVAYGSIDLGNDMFLRTNKPNGLFGGGFIILTNSGINKIVKYFEDNNLMVCIDVLDQLRHLLKLETIYALKPLCIQNDYFNADNIKWINDNINLEEYNNE